MSRKLLCRLWLMMLIMLLTTACISTGTFAETLFPYSVLDPPQVCYLGINQHQIDFSLLRAIELQYDAEVITICVDAVDAPERIESIPLMSIDALESDRLETLLKLIEEIEPGIIIVGAPENQPEFFRRLLDNLLSELNNLYSTRNINLLVVAPTTKENGGLPIAMLTDDEQPKVYYFKKIYSSPANIKVTSESLQQLAQRRLRFKLPVGKADDEILQALVSEAVDRLNQDTGSNINSESFLDTKLEILNKLFQNELIFSDRKLVARLSQYIYELGQRVNRFRDVIVSFDNDAPILLPVGGEATLLVSIDNCGSKRVHLDSLGIGLVSTISCLEIDQDILPYGRILRRAVINYDSTLFATYKPAECYPAVLYYHQNERALQFSSSIELKLVDPVEVCFIPERLVIKSSGDSDRPDWLVRNADVTVRFINSDSQTRIIRPRFELPKGIKTGVFPGELKLPPGSITDRNLKLNLKMGSSVKDAIVKIFYDSTDFSAASLQLTFRSSDQVKTLVISDTETFQLGLPFTIISDQLFCSMTPEQLYVYDNLILCQDNRCIDYQSPLIENFLNNGGCTYYSLSAQNGGMYSANLSDWSKYTLDTLATVISTSGDDVDTLRTSPYLRIPFFGFEKSVKANSECRMIVGNKEIPLWLTVKGNNGMKVFASFDFCMLSDQQLYEILLDMIEKCQ